MPLFEYQNQVYDLALTWEDTQPVLRVGERVYRPSLTELEPGSYLIQDGSQHERLFVHHEADHCQVWYQGQVYRLQRSRSQQAGQAKAQHSNRVVAPMTGKILQIKAQVGESVDAHQPVLVIESMKMETSILAPQAGAITAILCEVGQQVQNGQELMKLEPHGQE